MPAPPPTRPLKPPRRARRGSVYVLALGASTLVVIAGLSVIAITRAQGRMADAERDGAEASFAARSGIEIAAASVNSDTSWRSTYRDRAPIGPLAIGRASVSLYLADEADADLSNDATQPVRVTAVARAGGATRALSARLIPLGNAGLDALRASVFAQGDVTVTAPSASCGLLVTNGALVNSGVLTAHVEAASVSSTGFINGSVAVGASSTRLLPPSSSWNTLSAVATPLGFTNFADRLDRVLLTPASNPYGPANERGVYSITVPANRTLQIRRSRLRATLLVTLQSNSYLEIIDAISWDPGRPDQPALLVNGASRWGVGLLVSADPLSEAVEVTNFNPPGSPYNGVSNSSTTDVYPAGIRGLIHVIDPGSPVTVGGGTRLNGCLIVAGSVTIQGSPELNSMPSLLSSPPTGYARSTGITMQIEPGSYAWLVDAATSR